MSKTDKKEFARFALKYGYSKAREMTKKEVNPIDVVVIPDRVYNAPSKREQWESEYNQNYPKGSGQCRVFISESDSKL